MIEEIKEDNNCIVKAFENNPIAILHENNDNKKIYYFKASDVGSALGIVNIRTTIQNYEDEDEKVVRKVYDLRGCEQNTIFLSSQGVYRLLYNSKKEIAKKFRKWAGAILDDIIFNESMELKKQLQEKENKIKEQQKTISFLENRPETEGFSIKPGYIYLIKDASSIGSYKIGLAENPDGRLTTLNVSSSSKSLKMLMMFKTGNMKYSERIIHILLEPFRIRKRNEWFFFTNNIELNYAIDIIKHTFLGKKCPKNGLAPAQNYCYVSFQLSKVSNIIIGKNVI